MQVMPAIIEGSALGSSRIEVNHRAQETDLGGRGGRIEPDPSAPSNRNDGIHAAAQRTEDETVAKTCHELASRAVKGYAEGLLRIIIEDGKERPNGQRRCRQISTNPVQDQERIVALISLVLEVIQRECTRNPVIIDAIEAQRRRSRGGCTSGCWIACDARHRCESFCSQIRLM